MGGGLQPMKAKVNPLRGLVSQLGDTRGPSTGQLRAAPAQPDPGFESTCELAPGGLHLEPWRRPRLLPPGSCVLL